MYNGLLGRFSASGAFTCPENVDAMSSHFLESPAAICSGTAPPASQEQCGSSEPFQTPASATRGRTSCPCGASAASRPVAGRPSPCLVGLLLCALLFPDVRACALAGPRRALEPEWEHGKRGEGAGRGGTHSRDGAGNRRQYGAFPVLTSLKASLTTRWPLLVDSIAFAG